MLSSYCTPVLLWNIWLDQQVLTFQIILKLNREYLESSMEVSGLKRAPSARQAALTKTGWQLIASTR
jgi:hypothetical protein